MNPSNEPSAPRVGLRSVLRTWVAFLLRSSYRRAAGNIAVSGRGDRLPPARVGFSLYEARLYLALLAEGSQNGNEVAKRASVPSSKVYAALDKLASSRLRAFQPPRHFTRWAAIPPDELIARLRRHYNDPLDFLVEELPRVQAATPSEPFLTSPGSPPCTRLRPR